MFKDKDYGAPPEPKGNYRSLTNAEILESDKFRILFGDLAQDTLGSIDSMDFAIMAHDLVHGEHGRIGSFIASKLGPVVDKCVARVRYESEPVERIDPEAP